MPKRNNCWSVDNCWLSVGSRVVHKFGMVPVRRFLTATGFPGKRANNYTIGYKICITICITELRVILYHEKSPCKLLSYRDL